MLSSFLAIVASAALIVFFLSRRTDKMLLSRLGSPVYSDHGSVRVGWWQVRSPLGTVMVYPGGVVVIYVKTVFIEWGEIKSARISAGILRTLTIDHNSSEAGSPIVIWPSKGVDALARAIFNISRTSGAPLTRPNAEDGADERSVGSERTEDAV